MKKMFAGLGVLALVALGATGASIPASALAVQPVAEIVASPDAIVASPDAVLVETKPVVTTTAATPVEPVAVVAEPVVAPVAAPEPVVAPVVAPVAGATPVGVPVAPVASEPVAPVVAPVTPPVVYTPLEVELSVQCPTTTKLAVARWCDYMNGTDTESKLPNPNFTPEMCASLKPGDAWAGVSLVCGTDKREQTPVRKGVEVTTPVFIPPHAEPAPTTEPVAGPAS